MVRPCASTDSKRSLRGVCYRIDPGSNVMLLKFLGVIAVVSVAMCLVPAGAHFFELTKKTVMSQPEYMTVQKIYAGWSFFGIAVIAAHSPRRPPDQETRAECSIGAPAGQRHDRLLCRDAGHNF
jgi:hypothetical protein